MLSSSVITGKSRSYKILPYSLKYTFLPLCRKSGTSSSSSSLCSDCVKDGCETCNVSALVTEAIIKYRKNKNELNFQVLQSANSENCDLEISTKHGERQGETETDSQKIFSCSEKIYLAVPKVEKYENKTHISLTEVMDEGFICLFGSKQFRSLCDKICRHIGFKPNIIFESDNPAAVINMIGANIGVGFYPQFSWGKAQSEHIKLLEITDAPFYRDIVVTANLAKTNNEHLLDFYEFLVRFIKTKHKQSEKFNV